MSLRIGMITGCGKGIGFQMIDQFLENNDELFLIGINKSTNSDLDSLVDKYPNRFKLEINDITQTKIMNQILKKVYDTYGPIDFAICNAGIRSRCSMLRCDLDLYRNILENNTISNINIAKFLIENNCKINKKLNLLFISSIVGSRGFDELSSYAVSKSALEGFMKSAAVEYANRNILINCIAPGFIESSYAANFRENKKDLYDWTIEQTPMGRWGTCKEVADLAEYIVSEKNSYMTGSVVYCDGGWTAK